MAYRNYISIRVKICVIAGLLVLPLFPIFARASTTDGTVDSVFKYSWGETTGWINFGVATGNIHITDSGITGYAWSANYGWINLNPTKSGVKNDGEGNLSGYGWSENLGYINFGGVKINSSGQFTGSAELDNGKKINFDCSNCRVTTDWRPQSARTTASTPASTPTPSGVGGGGSLVPEGYYNLPTPPAGGFRILIQDGAEYTNSRTAALKLNGGQDAKEMIISNFSDFQDAARESYQTTKTWTLTGGDGAKTVYVKFYTQYGQPSPVVQGGIVLDTIAPEIKITGRKDYYSSAEDVVLIGWTEAGAEIVLHWARKYGLIHADNRGKLAINLGKMPVGDYRLELTPTDLAGNKGNTLTVGLVIKPAEKIPGAPPEVAAPEKPEEMIVIPEEAPLALRGNWKFLTYTILNEPILVFVQTPLPKGIRELAQKFPTLEKTFKEVGIGKIIDVEKLKTVKLTLPGLTERVGLPIAKIVPGRFALPAGIPIAKLSPQIKKQIPTEIVFAKTGGELIDLNIALSITDKGEPRQMIGTISGKPLQLAVKPDKPVKSIKGYVVFKSKRSQPISSQIPSNSLLASVIFANPVFSKPLTSATNDFVPIEGAGLTRFGLASKDGAKTGNFAAGTGKKPVKDEELVLLEFEYTDSDGDGIYTAEIQAPVVEGEYEIITVMDYREPTLAMKEIRLTTVVDPEGYIYEKDGDKETRVPGAIISLFWLNPETKQYELWPAKEYQQENPQTTDVRGTYSFLVPEGYYYLKAETPGYLVYDGKPFQVKEGSGIHINIELKTEYWWLNVVDWKTALLAIVVILLLYNFYRDKMRDRIKKQEL